MYGCVVEKPGIARLVKISPSSTGAGLHVRHAPILYYRTLPLTRRHSRTRQGRASQLWRPVFQAWRARYRSASLQTRPHPASLET